MLQVQTECDLARECRTLEELDLRAPEISVRLRVEDEVFGLKNVLGPLLDSNRRFRLVNRRLAKHLYRDQRRDNQTKTEDQPLPLQHYKQVIAKLVWLGGGGTIRPYLANIIERPVETTLDAGIGIKRLFCDIISSAFINPNS